MSLGGRRRKKKGVEEEHVNDERWMASYLDMVTVLMCMFIVLFAMSVIDQHKFDELRNSLATGFGTTATKHVDISKGLIVPKDQASTKAKMPSNLELAKIETSDLIALREKIRTSLKQVGLEETVSFTIDSRGLTVRLVGTETFFASNSVQLTSVAQKVLNIVGPLLRTSPYAVSVEGHADSRTAIYPFPTNWELSSGRATNVLRHLVEQGGFPATRIGAVGYGDARPIAKGTSPSALAVNRRVDIVVLSDQPDAVRALIPEADRIIEAP